MPYYSSPARFRRSSQMDTTIFVQLPQQAPYPSVQYSPGSLDAYQPMITSPQSSFVRSSAPRHMHPQQMPFYSDEATLTADSRSSSGSGFLPNDRSPYEQQREYIAESGSYNQATAAPRMTYEEYLPRSMAWQSVDRPPPLYDYGHTTSFDLPVTNGIASPPDMNVSSPYMKEDQEQSFSLVTCDAPAVLPPYYGEHEQSLAAYSTVPGQHTANHYSLPTNLASAGPPPSMAFGFRVSPQMQSQSLAPEPQDPPAETHSYLLSGSSQGYSSPSQLAYPSSPPDNMNYARFTQVTASSTISPELVYPPLPPSPPLQNGCDPRVTVRSPSGVNHMDGPGAGLELELDSVCGSSLGSPAMGATMAVERSCGIDYTGRVKRQRRVSFTSSSSSENDVDAGVADSGESEKEDMEDGEYVDSPLPNQRARFSRRRERAQAAFLPADSYLALSRKLAPPVPVPNLTKKSRGRRVPTGPVLVSRDGVQKNTRSFTCKVSGCGKCFARGEHLKRHVRSIHTNEKPHKCPYPGCGKDFSRHDNLGQHMRVHKDASRNPS